MWWIYNLLHRWVNEVAKCKCNGKLKPVVCDFCAIYIYIYMWNWTQTLMNKIFCGCSFFAFDSQREWEFTILLGQSIFELGRVNQLGRYIIVYSTRGQTYTKSVYLKSYKRKAYNTIIGWCDRRCCGWSFLLTDRLMSSWYDVSRKSWNMIGMNKIEVKRLSWSWQLDWQTAILFPTSMIIWF